MTDWHTTPPRMHPRLLEALDIVRGLSTVRGGAAYGRAPDNGPSDSGGRVYPYVVLWPGVGVAIDDDDVSGRIYQAGARLEFTTTVASGDPAWTHQVAADVQHALTGALGGRIQPNRLQQGSVLMGADTAERPARHYIPLTWTLTDHA